MKAVYLFGLLLTVAWSVQAADTAYTALRIVGKREGQDSLNRVIELRGRSGSPQPDVWKIVLDEPRARGGVREVEVQRGKIIGERTPTGRGLGSPMNFNQLNLDSEGAFTIANQEAQKVGVPFDRVDYVLKSGTGGGAPVWEMELFNGNSGRTGSLTIAADNGSVLHKQLDQRPRGSREDDRTFLEEQDRRNGNRQGDPRDDQRDYRGDGRSGSDRDQGGYSQPGESFRSVPDFFHRLGNRFKKRGHQLENFFTGKGKWHDTDEQ